MACWVFIAAHGLSLVVASGGDSLVVVLRLLTGVASFVAEHRLYEYGSGCGVQAWLSMARGIFLDQKWNPCPLHWQADSSPLDQRGSPINEIFESCHSLFQGAGMF